jgi:hypothetical protein
MAGMLDELMGALGGTEGGLGSLVAGVLGGDADDKTEKAAGVGLEAILGGLAGNAADPRKATALFETLDRHDGSAIDQIGDKFASPEAMADGDKILGHIFGNEKETVTQNIASKSGLDAGSIAKLLPALAPVVMGMLGKKKAEGSLDPGGLAGMLKGEADGLDLGDILGALTGGGSGSASLGGILGKLKGLFGR